ncbi:carbohydrate esterase family 4 protein [Pisolithus microcarpus 441]|uniref:chitin deacetylase n=1 Tax=Pisolithus microcarpus 441 TaxID=765257 RepID=A0A0D0A5G0_9AGAM|nr:carbohydrate esterase family 4 protein [Pisolithus microcarpus]KIK29627.1 carbohydrate esterase family 4 protein [Pisolithus microcarpus 441]
MPGTSGWPGAIPLGHFCFLYPFDLPTATTLLPSRPDTNAMRLSSLFASRLTCLFISAYVFPSANAQDRTTEQGEAQISDPSVECTPYQYPPVTNARNNFPPSWTVATVISGDSEAQAKYQDIESSIPNIPPKGTQPDSLVGDWGDFTYDPSDPDCWWTFAKCTTPKIPGIPDDIAELPEPNTLGYGFDDGPNCSHNAFYDYLSSQEQKATMFYIGSNVMDWPLEAQRGLADGHEICVHTWSHRYMTSLTNDEAFAELWYTMQMIKLVVGVTPTCWRPPFGDVDDRIRAIADALGLTTIMWQYDSNDWRFGSGNVTEADIDANYMDLITAAENGTFSTSGTMMLTHELNNFTMSEAVKFYDQLASAFSYLVPVGVALNVTTPYVEDGYTLPSFAEYISGTHTGSVTGSADGSSDGSGIGSSTSSGNPTVAKKSGATKVSLSRAGSFASVVLIAAIQLMS